MQQVRNLLRLTMVGKESTEERATKLVRHDLGAVLSLQSGPSNKQSSLPVHLLLSMNMLTEMGIMFNKRTIMWRYFEAHPQVQRTFPHILNEDRRDIIVSVVKSQFPSND
ncbi:hypothetical protein TIFTF001_003796 [Ficus carica]|uniref:Uncharacterized protein n=1 Tax=Ficus carica TaxID=3494 RepID=A0AA87ZF58_FICCA|nr:hypothetical protein TIFTF001_003796 [Ficus carica]